MVSVLRGRCIAATRNKTIQGLFGLHMSLTSVDGASGELLGALEASRLGKAMDGAGLLVPESCYQSSLESA
jgi:hypothetical protein